MSLLARYSTAAERKRYCVFAEGFERSDLIKENGGAITGTPTIHFGALIRPNLEGDDDNIKYTLTGNEFNSPIISMVMEFTPAFALEDGDAHILMTASLGGNEDYLIEKNAGDDLIVKLGDEVVAEVVPAVLSDYWLQNERNVVVVSGTSGATDVWFNGIAVSEADATVWSPTLPLSMWVGADETDNNGYNGYMHSLKIFHCLLDGTEALDYYDYGKHPGIFTPVVIP